MLGDTGQIIILGGLEEDESYFCNEYTKLFIKCIKKVALPDPKCLLRVSQKMPDSIINDAIDCISTSIGSPLLSNDDIIIPLLAGFGYDKKDKYNYGVSACWEPLAIGMSLEQNNLAHIEYGAAANKTICDPSFCECQQFEDVFDIYKLYLEATVEDAIKRIDSITWELDPILTLFTDGCSAKGKDISKGGAKYCNYGILSDGLSAAVDTLLNIKNMCFLRKTISLSELQAAITSNYIGFDLLRAELSKNLNGFGTESLEAITLTNDIIAYTELLLKNYRNQFGGKVKFGLSSPGYVTRGRTTGATADGRYAGMPFATHISRDSNESITQILNFASELKYSSICSNGNVVDLIVQPNLLIDNKEKFKRVIRAAINIGVFQFQFNVISYAQLVDAKEHPEKYPNLIVRVWGFSAFFRELPEAYQDQIIFRAKKMEGIV